MALTRLGLLVLATTNAIFDHVSANIGGPPIKIDPKRRTELVDEAFIQQKDILLEMLETKLKDMREKRKKHHSNEEHKYDSLPRDLNVKLKANGISAVGETDILLKYGNDGKGALNLDASGISNIGKAHLDLGIGDGSLYIPGLNNLFAGKLFYNKANEPEVNSSRNNTATVETRKSDTAANINDITLGNGGKAKETPVIIDSTTATAVANITLPVSATTVNGTASDSTTVQSTIKV